jgi:thiamine-monophosphate kinase
VASKALRVNLSDLAAKGARPLGFLLSLAIQRTLKKTGSADLRRDCGETQCCSAARCSGATPIVLLAR